jgi:signal transduction histidine kinase
MMTTSRYFGPPARLLLLFVLLAGLPLAVLGWLGWRLLDQDRALEHQRVRDRLDNDASLLAAESGRVFSGWEALLGDAAVRASAMPAGTIFLRFDSQGVVRNEGVALPYYPAVDSGTEAPAAVFAQAEEEEFRGGGPDAAAAIYRKLATTSNERQRAAALMRLARCLRKQNKILEALRVYSDLAVMGGVSVAGSPAELLARGESVALYQMLGDGDTARSESTRLVAVLQEGRYRIDRATFEVYKQSAPLPLRVDASSGELARAVEDFWPLWREQNSGRAVIRSSDHVFAAVWRKSANGTAAITGSLESVLAPVLKLARSLQVRVAVENESGIALTSGFVAHEEQASKSFRETGLPWTIRVTPANPAGMQQAWEFRRNLFIAGFGLMAIVIAAAAYFIFRAVRRELGVARLQSDFVSAVSHEFRTPLTAMCHLTEMLEENGAPQDRLPQYYRALARETRRLHGLVESLLDFGRMESDKRTYHLEETDAAELARQVMEEFRERTESGAKRLTLHTPADPFVVRADREAIALALRNLVDNALKYSPDSLPVEISVSRRGDLAGISVEDRGPGIPKDEQRAVFRKFVRGEAARNANVKGTGIGLALAEHIVKAHGGSLELASQLGRGSRFTILLPARPGRT